MFRGGGAAAAGPPPLGSRVRVKLDRLPVGHKSHPPSSPRSLPISSVVDVSQEKRLHGRSITGFIHLVWGGECVPEREAKETAIRSTIRFAV